MVRGELVCSEDDGPRSESRARDKFYRWHCLAVYAGAEGEKCQWYVSVGFRTNNTGFETDQDDVWGFETADEMEGFLEYVYSPLAYLNMPAWDESDPRMKDVQARKKSLSGRWASMVGAAMNAVEEWETK